jgi:hypothetical protein
MATPRKSPAKKAESEAAAFQFEYKVKSSTGGMFHIFSHRQLEKREIDAQIAFIVASTGGPKKGKTSHFKWPEHLYL